MALLWSELCFRNINLVIGARIDKKIEVTLHNQARHNESFSDVRGLERRKNMNKT